jgi:uncharacterized protein involved in exopolysaccharide biosynthesis
MDDETGPRSGSNRSAAGIPEDVKSTHDLQGVEDDTVTLADYFGVISRNRRMIFWICVITMVTTAIVSLLLPKMFSATASVVPPVDFLQREAALAGGLGSVKSDILRKAMDVSSIADMYVGILRSRSIADAIIERFNLGEVYKVKDSNSVVRQILKKRTAIQVTDEGIVTITVEDRSPRLAAELANAYVEELDRQNKRLFVGQAASKKIFLENRIKEIEQELSRIDNLLSRDAKIKEMLFELLTREYEIAKIEEAKSMPTIQVLDKAVVPEKRSRPKRRQIVMLAGATGLFAAIIAAFVRDYLAKARLVNRVS